MGVLSRHVRVETPHVGVFSPNRNARISITEMEASHSRIGINVEHLDIAERTIRAGRCRFAAILWNHERRIVWATLCGTLLLSACVFHQVKQQQERMAAMCRIEGTLSAPQEPGNPLVVVLIQRDGARREIFDHYVLERPGRWYFVAAPGTYSLAAFSDRNGDLSYEPGEPVVFSAKQLDLSSGARMDAIELTISSHAPLDALGEIDLRVLRVRSIHDASAAGEVADLSDPRFDPSKEADDMGRPFDFILNARPGIYFLEPYDARKVPVLFVHGIKGTPRDFEPLIARLDRGRLQPWAYFYPTGIDLDTVAEHLSQLIIKLRVRYGFKRLLVVGHSMGGLVSRAAIQKIYESTGREDVDVFVSISTPWGGDELAGKAVDHDSAVVPSWRDMAPDSPFLTGLFYADSPNVRVRRLVPVHVTCYLVFTYLRNSHAPGASGDGVVTVASQLRPEAQDEATRIFGFDEDHASVLSSPQVAATLNDLFARVTKSER
jgi:pimeloyl-ACP methyl ester carboxylesterase